METYEAKWLEEYIKNKLRFHRYMENESDYTAKQTQFYVYEFFEYNIKGFRKFKAFNEDYKIIGTDIVVPIYTIEDATENPDPHIIVILNCFGELHYLFKNKTTLDECIEKNNNVVSFGMKTGESLYFVKHYINSEYTFHEEYRPGKTVITNIRKRKEKTPNWEEYSLTSSPFLRGGFCPESDYIRIVVTPTEENEFEVSIYDLVTGEVHQETYAGKSLYSAYYRFMIDNGYFSQKDLSFLISENTRKITKKNK